MRYAALLWLNPMSCSHMVKKRKLLPEGTPKAKTLKLPEWGFFQQTQKNSANKILTCGKEPHEVRGVAVAEPDELQPHGEETEATAKRSFKTLRLPEGVLSRNPKYSANKILTCGEEPHEIRGVAVAEADKLQP